MNFSDLYTEDISSFDPQYINESIFLENCSSIGIDAPFSNLTEVVVLFTEMHFPTNYAIPLYGYGMQILFIVTTIANSIIIAVLGQKNMRSPTNVMLIAISLSDLLTIVFPTPVFFYMYSLEYYAAPIYPVGLCYAWSFLIDVIPNFFHTASIWLTVGLAAQRYIYVCHAHVARVWCNIPRVMKLILYIFIVATLHQSTRFIEFYYLPTCVGIGKEILPACTVHFYQWVTNNEDIYFGFYFWFRVFFVHLGPCTILLALNLLLFKALRQAQKRREQLLQEKRKSESKKLRDSNCTTMMLIVIVTVFLITEIPLAVITLLHLLTSMGWVEVFSIDSYDKVKQFFILSNFFIILSYPINFAIYCGMSRQFRETFKQLFLYGKVSSVRRDESTRYSFINGGNRNTRESIL